jgi:alkaline phosphatase
MKKKLFFVAGLFLIALSGFELGPISPRPKRIIFLIGDGMGLSQVTASLYAQKNKSVFEQFPFTGLITTHSASDLVTDSGAGGTALACGCKTYNGAIGLDAHKKRCTSLLEIADSLGLATGIAVNCSVTHATPASFVAHASSRKEMEFIATWYIDNSIDYIVGGGEKYFQNRTTLPERNLLEELRSQNYFISLNAHDSLPPVPDPNRPFLWLNAKDDPPSALEGRSYLPEAVKRGCTYLYQRGAEKGFFLMVEGSQIDWAGHGNDGTRLLAEMLDFEKTVEAALQFAQQDGETLVVVTADHETGGLGIVQGSTMDSLELKFVSNGHTASMVPVFAFGPGADLFSGIYDNTQIYYRIKKAMGWE